MADKIQFGSEPIVGSQQQAGEYVRRERPDDLGEIVRSTLCAHGQVITSRTSIHS